MKCHYCQTEADNLTLYRLNKPDPNKPAEIHVCRSRTTRTMIGLQVVPWDRCQRWAKQDGYTKAE